MTAMTYPGTPTPTPAPVRAAIDARVRALEARLGTVRDLDHRVPHVPPDHPDDARVELADVMVRVRALEAVVAVERLQP